MLREFFYRTAAIKDAVSQYDGIDISDNDNVVVIMARQLTPDSFIWKIEINSERYYLYAEDYVQSKAHVIEEIENIAGQNTGSLLKVRQIKDFNDLSPVKSADVYTQPENYENDLQPYASDSGYDLVFLYKINQSKSTKVRGSVSG
ncbi:MAG TPA: hypothetical protein VF281_03115 [Candidatus Saccharimonadales bacterium]